VLHKFYFENIHNSFPVSQILLLITDCSTLLCKHVHILEVRRLLICYWRARKINAQ